MVYIMNKSFDIKKERGMIEELLKSIKYYAFMDKTNSNPIGSKCFMDIFYFMTDILDRAPEKYCNELKQLATKCYKDVMPFIQKQHVDGIIYDRIKKHESNKEYVKMALFARIGSECGCPKCQNKLGFYYEQGVGTAIAPNVNKATKLYIKAAANGNADAQYNLGICYETGNGVEKNEHSSCAMYRLAAAQGHDGAQNNLACCYLDGIGVQKNLEKAKKLFKLAATKGNVNAKENLLKFTQTNEKLITGPTGIAPVPIDCEKHLIAITEEDIKNSMRHEDEKSWTFLG